MVGPGQPDGFGFMIKVSISLPNNALITFEAEETAVVQEVVSAVLRDLPRDLMQAAQLAHSNGHTHGNSGGGNGAAPHASPDNGTAPEVPSVITPSEVPVESNGTHTPPPTPPLQAQPSPQPQAISDNHQPSAEPQQVVQPPQPVAQERLVAASERLAEVAATDRRTAEMAALSAAADLAFIQFCQSANPVGDMRKVVVAAEGASQFLEMPSVSAEDLEDLFDRVGWLQPHNFTQTLRNAARSKFRWLERVPGRAGQYTVTPLGREKTLSG